MKKLKSAFITILIVCICFTFVPNVYASTNITISDKADALNTIAILTGDGAGDYMLDTPLLRSQAAIFITRLLGKTDHVLQNKEFLSVTKFPDVSSTAWYAPYVGYCSIQGIIAGDDKGYYLPDNNISEKQFLKLLITTLGYEYTIDFSWNNVYQKAYEIGLVKDSSYLTRTLDNNSYARKDVVIAIYNALTIIDKKTKVTLLQNLINENAITREQAVLAGLASTDSSNVSITQITSMNQNSIFIMFDKKVANIAVEDIIIYESGDRSKRLDVSIQAKQPETIVINTSDQIAYLEYTVEISNVTVAGGVLSTALSTKFEGFRASELKSDFFRISKIEPVSKSTINVYFTHPVNKNSEKVSYYEILEGSNVLAQGSINALTAKYSVTPNNLVVVSLQGVAFVEGQQYILKVSGDLTSIYGVKLNEGQGDTLRFSVGSITGGAVTNTGLSMTKVSLLDYKTMQLEFNMEVHPTRAQQISSFYITDSNGNFVAISKAAIGGSGTQSGKIVYLSISGAFVKTSNYKIMINEILDISRQYSIIEKDYSFSGNYPERTVLNIQSVAALDKNTITVYFDRPVEQTAASTKEYYSIAGISLPGYTAMPAKVVFDPVVNPYKVNLYLPVDKELLSNNTYKLTVLSVMRDSLGNLAGINREATFYGNSISGAKPFISDAVIISKDTVKITTSRDISLSVPNISASNYSLEYVEGSNIISTEPAIIVYINSTTLILKFDTLDFNKEYTLRFNSLKDYSELYTRTAADGQSFIKVRLGK